AVTWAVPEGAVGEDVGSGGVWRAEGGATRKDIRQFTVGRIADFKVPRQVLSVRELPKGSTGKVQRVGLAAKLGLASHATPQTFVAPRTPLEKALAALSAEMPLVQRVRVHDYFFSFGR